MESLDPYNYFCCNGRFEADVELLKEGLFVDELCCWDEHFYCVLMKEDYRGLEFWSSEELAHDGNVSIWGVTLDGNMHLIKSMKISRLLKQSRLISSG